MKYQRLAYDDASTPSEMASDCHAVEQALALPAPSTRYEDFPRKVRKPAITIDEAAARLAARIHP